jgi:hypothetical protein
MNVPPLWKPDLTDFGRYLQFKSRIFPTSATNQSSASQLYVGGKRPISTDLFVSVPDGAGRGTATEQDSQIQR